MIYERLSSQQTKKRDDTVSECIHGALKSVSYFYWYIITLLFFELEHAEWRTVKGSNNIFFVVVVVVVVVVWNQLNGLRNSADFSVLRHFLSNRQECSNTNCYITVLSQFIALPY